MLRILNIVFLLSVSVSFAQKKYVHFSFESSETKFIGEKVKVLDEELYGVYIPEAPSAEMVKIIIDQSGIYYLNDKMERSTDLYTTSSADHILYKDETNYWLFKKSEGAKSYRLFKMQLSRKEYKSRLSYFEPVMMEEEFVEELMDFYHEEKVKAKYKDGVVALKEIDEEMLVYVVTSTEKKRFSPDPAFTVYVKSPDCISGNIIEKFEDNQFDELKMTVKPVHQGTGLQEKIVIDASGMYSCTASGDNKSYIFKPDDANYILKKIDRYGYVALIKTENEFYRMIIFKPSNKQISFSAIRENADHGFYSESESRVAKGARVYLLCELNKYLKYGIDRAGTYNGTRLHW